MKWTRVLSIIHLLSAPVFLVLLWDDSVLSSAGVSATLAGSAALLWFGNRWTVIYSGVLALLSLLFLFILAFSVYGPEEHIAPTATGTAIFLALQAGAVVTEWVTAKSAPEITIEPE
ncbi:MAG: hypothetical protein IH602_04505 [Bryobacteraceae bacterium]|nr:hypothetical protein [Bryobacteraceae bacterium]